MEKWEWRYYFKRLTKKYYIINRSAGGAGFFSNYMWVLGHVIFAGKLGYIPVVDMLNFPTLYSEKEGVAGEKNAWNYYFENVSGVSLEEAYASGSYVMGMDMPLSAIRSQIGSAIDIIVHLGRLRDRSRRVLKIIDIVGYDGGIDNYQNAYPMTRTFTFGVQLKF